MSSEENRSIIQISKIHQQRLLEALAAIKDLFPLTAEKIANLTQAQLYFSNTNF